LKNATKIRKQEKKKAKKEAKKKEERKQQELQEESNTLFVRNIGFETNERKFKEFMEKFGPVKYAVLCKPKEIGQLDPENKEENKMAKMHKGNGFVKFKSKDSAE